MEAFENFVETYYYPYASRVAVGNPDIQLLETTINENSGCLKLDSMGRYSNIMEYANCNYSATYINTCHYVAGSIVRQIIDELPTMLSGHDDEIYLKIFKMVLEKDPQISTRVKLNLDVHCILSPHFTLEMNPDRKESYYKYSTYTNLVEFHEDNTNGTPAVGIMNPYDIDYMGTACDRYQYYHYRRNMTTSHNEYMIYDMSVKDMGEMFEFLRDRELET